MDKVWVLWYEERFDNTTVTGKHIIGCAKTRAGVVKLLEQHLAYQKLNLKSGRAYESDSFMTWEIPKAYAPRYEAELYEYSDE